MLEHGEVGIDEVARAIKAIEPARDRRLLGFCAEMPFACHHRAVAALAQPLSERWYVRQNGATVAGQAAIFCHVPHSRLMLIKAG